MSLYDDVLRAGELLNRQSYQAHRPLLSPTCGIDGAHDECHSAICECQCHIDAALKENE